MEDIQLILGDCLEKMKEIPDKSVDLVILDPPYFSTKINELGDNLFRTEKEYIEWLKNVLLLIDSKLKSNGSIYMFHNDLFLLTDILFYIKHELEWKLQNHIKWNKFPTHTNFSRIIKTFGKNRKFSQTFSEDIFYFTKRDVFETPFSTILKNGIKENNLKLKDVSALCPSKNGKLTGWVSNKIKGTQIPTKEQWDKICNLFKIKNEYDTLHKQYKNERYKFNQPYIKFKGKNIEEQKELLKPFSEVWEYEKDKVDNFYTVKPLKMIESIINISSDENDLILDPFMGSGTTGIACKNLNRKFIGIEIIEEYYKISEERIKGE